MQSTIKSWATVLSSFFLATPCFASLIQPAIAPKGVVNAASYIAPGFANQGIARGSMFLIFGNYLGPATLVQATSYPLPSSDGLAGTRVHIDSGGYSGDAFMIYTSAQQVAAILPSTAPIGDATLTLNYNNLTSNPVVIHIVNSAFGMFTLNQGGTGPAIVQNYLSASQAPVNTFITPANPFQTAILWGTGLGPVTGDEASGPLPGDLPFLDTLYVGGVPASIDYAGRSGCCAGVDQIVFEVPPGVSGCYVPVAVVTGGVLSNLGTIAVATSASVCDDPLSFRNAALTTLLAANQLKVGQITVEYQAAPGTPNGSDTLTGTFFDYTLQSLTATAPVNPSLGTCYATETLSAASAPTSQGTAMNAGAFIQSTGPGGSLMASSVSPGSYAASTNPANLPAGPYSIFGSGGPDVGLFLSNFTVTAAGQWTNPSDYSSPTITTGKPFTFTWTGGDPNGYVSIQVSSTNAVLATSIVCNAAASSGSFTVPAYLTSLLIQGQGNVAVGFASAPSAFSAPGLDAGTLTPIANSVLPVNFLTPPSQ